MKIGLKGSIGIVRDKHDTNFYFDGGPSGGLKGLIDSAGGFTFGEARLGQDIMEAIRQAEAQARLKQQAAIATSASTAPPAPPAQPPPSRQLIPEERALIVQAQELESAMSSLTIGLLVGGGIAVVGIGILLLAGGKKK